MSKKGALSQIVSYEPLCTPETPNTPTIPTVTTKSVADSNHYPPPNGGFPVIPLILGGSILVCVCVWCYNHL